MPDRRQSLASNYINFRKKYKKFIKECKQKSWENFVTESTAENAWGLVYKISKDKLNN
jgi:hypothetical protein